jgi:hypothetical protein
MVYQSGGDSMAFICAAVEEVASCLWLVTCKKKRESGFRIGRKNKQQKENPLFAEGGFELGLQFSGGTKRLSD